MACVSVIIPIYNVEKYLTRCMNSIVNQSLYDIEIIMVDDGSPDSCPQMCDEWARQDTRIKVVHKTNGGLGDARNAGLEVATGEYVTFIDSDDYQSLEAYEVLYEEAKRRDADIVYGGLIYYDRQGNSSLCSLHNLGFYGEEVLSYLKNLLNPVKVKSSKDEYCMSVCIGLFRRSLIEQHHIRFKSERNVLSEDLLFDFELIPHCTNIRCIPHCFYHYCYNSGSLSQNFNPIKIQRCICQYELMLKIAEELNLDEFKLDIISNFILNIRGSIMKGIILSNASFYEKKKYLMKIYSYEGWKNIFKYIQLKHKPFLERVIIYVIKYRLSLLNMIIYKAYYSILGR